MRRRCVDVMKLYPGVNKMACIGPQRIVPIVHYNENIVYFAQRRRKFVFVLFSSNIYFLFFYFTPSFGSIKFKYSNGCVLNWKIHVYLYQNTIAFATGTSINANSMFNKQISQYGCFRY